MFLPHQSLGAKNGEPLLLTRSTEGENREWKGRILATHHAGWEKDVKLLPIQAKICLLLSKNTNSVKTESCCGSRLYLPKNILYSYAVGTGRSFCPSIFDFCSVFFNEKVWKREKLWRLHAFMERNSAPGWKPCTARVGSLSTAELLWSSPEVLTSVSSYLGRWPDSDKFCHVLVWFLFFFPKYLPRRNTGIKHVD